MSEATSSTAQGGAQGPRSWWVISRRWSRRRKPRWSGPGAGGRGAGKRVRSWREVHGQGDQRQGQGARGAALGHSGRGDRKVALEFPTGCARSRTRRGDRVSGDSGSGLDKGERVDGRDSDTVRPITIETGVLPRSHGSPSSPGQTQALVAGTLGTSDDEQRSTRRRAGETPSRSCCTTLPALCTERSDDPRTAAARSGTGRWPRGASADAPAFDGFPTPCGSSRKSWNRRLLVHGHRLSRVARPDGCRCADQVRLRRRGDGLIKEGTRSRS